MAWLERWANDEGAPPPIDNAPLVCKRHGGGAGGASKLDPGQVHVGKRVSPEAWAQLQAEFQGGPELSSHDVCRECLAGRFSSQLLSGQADEVRARAAALLEAQGELGEGAGLEDELDPSLEQYFISKQWLQGWLKRQGASISADKSPTHDLACPHGQLLPVRQVKTAKRVAVPRDIWLFLRDLWAQQVVKEAQQAAARRRSASAQKGKKGAAGRAGGASGAPEVVLLDDDGAEVAAAAPGSGAASPSAQQQDDGEEAGGNGGVDDDDGGGDDVTEVQPEGGQEESPPGGGLAGLPGSPPPEPRCAEFRAGACFECSQCAGSAGQQLDAELAGKRRAAEEAKALGMLAADSAPTLEVGATYYMLPTTWVREWQSFVKQGAKGSRPGPLRPAMLSLLCSCHPHDPRLAVSLPELAVQRKKVTQAKPDDDPVRLVPEAEWHALRVLYGGDDSGGGAQQEAVVIDLSSGSAAAGNGSAAAAPEALDAVRRGFSVTVASVAPDAAQDYAAAGPAPRGAPPAAAPAPTPMVVDVDAAWAPSGAGAGDMDLGSGGEGDGDSDRGGLDGDGEAGVVRAFVGGRDDDEDFVPGGAAGGAGRKRSSGRLAGPSGRAPAGASAANGSGRSAPGSKREASIGPPPPGASGAGAAAASAAVLMNSCPPPCFEALAALERAAREAALCYADAEVMAELVTAEELDGSFRDAHGAGERKSKRSRKGRVALRVSNTTTLQQLKLELWQSLAVHPKNQMVYVRGAAGLPRLLEGDALSLAQHEVLPDQELRVVRGANANVDDDDYSTLFDGASGGAGKGKRREVETGFKNTALHGDVPPAGQPQPCAASGNGSGGEGLTGGPSADGP